MEEILALGGEAKPMQLQAAGVTDMGRLKRNNEDALALFPEQGLFIVADGMGGMAAGEVAAQMAVESIPRTLLGSSELASDPEQALSQALRRGSFEIWERAAGTQSMTGMGAAVVVAYVADGRAIVCHAGDSRAYLLRQGSLECLTDDHTVVGSLIRRGLLEPAKASTHPLRSQLTRHAGLRELKPEIQSLPLESGDRLLLCSDGLTKEIEDQEIQEMLVAAQDVQQAAQQLVEAARTRRGRDNITALVVDLA